VSIVENLLGPLSAVECRQSLRRKSLAWIRMAASLPVAVTLLVTLWVWWLSAHLGADFLPGPILYVGLLVAEGLAVAAALLLSPSMLAGTIAGEKDRGTMELLLSSPLSAVQIVVARLAGRFTQIGMYAAAGLPLLLLLATLCHDSLLTIVVLVLLPMFIAFGASGLTLATSTLARRGRDALMAIYLLEVLVIAAAYFGGNFFSTTVVRWLGPLNPLSVIGPLVNQGATAPALITCLLWMLLGLIGIALSSWQLRSSFLRHTGGKSSRKGTRRRRRVPPIGKRPMLWKELYIERDAFGRWLRLLLMATLAGAAIVLATALVWQQWMPSSRSIAQETVDWLSEWIAMTSIFVLWLLQWSIGLHAAGTIAQERQRATWDALLTTPMSGREIVGSKTLGSLYALRWLAIVTLIAWTLAVIGGGMTIWEFVEQVAFLVAGGTFMAAAGVLISSSNQNPTRSLATTMGTWMGAAVASTVLAGLLSAGVLLIGMFAWAMYIIFILPPPHTMVSSTSSPFFDFMMGAIYSAIRILLYLITTVAIVQYIAQRFDHLAGRISRKTDEPLGELFQASEAREAKPEAGTVETVVEESASRPDE